MPIFSSIKLVWHLKGKYRLLSYFCLTVFLTLPLDRYLYGYQEAMPVEQVVKNICNYKQAYTQYGGLRPFGTAFLFAGWDKHFGFQLYQTDPSGNYSGWKATVIGKSLSASSSNILVSNSIITNVMHLFFRSK